MARKSKAVLVGEEVAKAVPTRARNNLVVVSDLHIGCQMGLLHPDGLARRGGSTHPPSELQLKIWAMWEYFWTIFVPEVCHGEPFDVLINGETVDGVHHGNVTAITQNMRDQLKGAIDTLEKGLLPHIKKVGGRLYVNAGTIVHSGDEGCNDDTVAEALGAIPDKYGHYARYSIKLRVGDAVVFAAHKIMGNRSPWYETTAPHVALSKGIYNAGRWGKTLPDFLIRSHRHQYVETRIGTHKGFGASVVTPAWQAPTPWFMQNVDPDGNPQFGGIVIRQGDQEAYTRVKVWTFEKESDDIE